MSDGWQVYQTETKLTSFRERIVSAWRLLCGGRIVFRVWFNPGVDTVWVDSPEAFIASRRRRR